MMMLMLTITLCWWSWWWWSPPYVDDDVDVDDDHHLVCVRNAVEQHGEPMHICWEQYGDDDDRGYADDYHHLMLVMMMMMLMMIIILCWWITWWSSSTSTWSLSCQRSQHMVIDSFIELKLMMIVVLCWWWCWWWSRWWWWWWNNIRQNKCQSVWSLALQWTSIPPIPAKNHAATMQREVRTVWCFSTYENRIFQFLQIYKDNMKNKNIQKNTHNFTFLNGVFVFSLSRKLGWKNGRSWFLRSL